MKASIPAGFAFGVLLVLMTACSGGPEEERGQKTSAEPINLEALFDAYHAFSMKSNPEWASYEGDQRFADKVTDNSAAGVAARFDTLKAFRAALLEIDTAALSDARKVNYDLFLHSLEEQISAEKFAGHLMPLNQQGGLHIDVPQIIEYQPLAQADDYTKYFARLRQFPTQVGNAIDNMRTGIARRITQPRFIIEQVMQQIDNIRRQPLDDMPFMMPLKDASSDLSDADRLRLENELRTILSRDLIPAYDTLHSFLANEYLPKCREGDGIWALPEGAERYRFAIRSHTTTDLTADEIFSMGKEEVERIYGAMELLKDEIGFAGTMQVFNQFLRSDPQFYYTDKELMMADYRRILDTMDVRLPQLFGRLPKTPYALKEMEGYRAASAPQAYYYSAPDDGSRPGYFYVNTYDLPSRPKYTMTALALHEAVPGHHLQISLAKEFEDIPWFRRHLGFTAYVEGWGLYAEHLGYETGMYQDLYQRFGALTFEIWRACRLVVDAGIHHKKWTREEAVQFMLKYTPNSEHDIRSEVDRYIVWPGQALAYKIGELKLKELRAHAETELGAEFDVRAFHDMVLNDGAIPLSMLVAKVDRWIASQKKAS